MITSYWNFTCENWKHPLCNLFSCYFKSFALGQLRQAWPLHHQYQFLLSILILNPPQLIYMFSISALVMLSSFPLLSAVVGLWQRLNINGDVSKKSTKWWFFVSSYQLDIVIDGHIMRLFTAANAFNNFSCVKYGSIQRQCVLNLLFATTIIAVCRTVFGNVRNLYIKWQ